MEVSLTPALERIVREKVESGLYCDSSEVFREALRLLVEREAGLDWLRKEAAIGFEAIDRGDALELSREDFFRELSARSD